MKKRGHGYCWVHAPNALVFLEIKFLGQGSSEHTKVTSTLVSLRSAITVSPIGPSCRLSEKPPAFLNMHKRANWPGGWDRVFLLLGARHTKMTHLDAKKISGCPHLLTWLLEIQVLWLSWKESQAAFFSFATRSSSPMGVRHCISQIGVSDFSYLICCLDNTNFWTFKRHVWRYQFLHQLS